MTQWKISRSSPPEMFLGKGILKVCSKFLGEYPCRNVICNFIEITLQHGCSSVNLLNIFRTPFYKNTSGGLLLNILEWINFKLNFYDAYIRPISECKQP